MTEMKAYELFKQLVEGMAYMNDKRNYHHIQDYITGISNQIISC